MGRWPSLGHLPNANQKTAITESNKRQQKAIDAVLEREVPVFLDLYLYDHSGITMRTYPFNCRWDSGQVGYAYITKEAIRENWNLKRVSKEKIAHAERILKSEVQAYDDFLTGNVFGYITKDAEGEHLDSCWGFYGKEYMIEEVKSGIDYQEAKELERIAGLEVQIDQLRQEMYA